MRQLSFLSAHWNSLNAIEVEQWEEAGWTNYFCYTAAVN